MKTPEKSERSSAEAQALERARARLELVLRVSKLIVWDFEMPDPPSAQLPAELIEQAERWHPQDRDKVLEAVAACLRGETNAVDVEYRALSEDGSYTWRLGRAIPFREAPDASQHLLGGSLDLGRLRAAKPCAESWGRSKDGLLASIGHEIRTPMNAILGMTELVLDTPLDATQRESLRTVKSAADELLGVINDLLDFCSIKSGKLELVPAEFSLRAGIGDTLRALALRAHRKGLELVCNIQQDVPDALIGDSRRLQQVLINLLGNAIKFTERGEAVLEVGLVSVTDQTAVLRFTVRDTGVGISANTQAAIFAAFEQEDRSTTRKCGGAGLGLTISAHLVSLMGGSIKVESAQGRGSTFEFSARFEVGGRAVSTPERLATSLEGMHVLIVGDNAVDRGILEQWLRLLKLAPTSVATGMEAMDALWHGTTSDAPFQLVFLDSRLPDMDGVVLLGKIRERVEFERCRVVLLTSGGQAGEHERIRGLRLEAQLQKPVSQDELFHALQDITRRFAELDPKRPLPAAGDERDESPRGALACLVVEDNEFSAQLLSQLLSKLGHRVQIASTGAGALEALDVTAFDLLVLELHLPELDGFEVVAQVRARERLRGGHLPVIALTARAHGQEHQRCLAAGMDEYLVKPIDARKLWAAIERLVPSRVSSGAS